MKKIAFASIVAAGFAAAVLGLASPAQADLGHNIWANNQNGHSVTAAQVDTPVHQSR
jgi:anti-sigma factor RsiW